MAQQQHNKFQYQDFGRSGSFVQSQAPNPAGAEAEKARFIREAVSEHLSENVVAASVGDMMDIKTHVVGENPNDAPALPKEVQDVGEIKTHSFGEDGQILGEVEAPATTMAPVVPEEPMVDLERIKEESYQRGYKEAESLLSPKLEAQEGDKAFDVLIKDKLDSIRPAMDLKDNMFEMLSGLITIIAKKLHLTVPADFEAIILGEMVPVLNKHYKNGSIIVKVNPERVDYCNNLFKIGELPEKVFENIELIPDESVAKNDCNIEWQDALLKYNQEDLIVEADKILDHLKTKIEN